MSRLFRFICFLSPFDLDPSWPSRSSCKLIFAPGSGRLRSSLEQERPRRVLHHNRHDCPQLAPIAPPTINSTQISSLISLMQCHPPSGPLLDDFVTPPRTHNPADFNCRPQTNKRGGGATCALRAPIASCRPERARVVLKVDDSRGPRRMCEKDVVAPSPANASDCPTRA